MWLLTLYADTAQTSVAATWRFHRMKDAAAVLGVKLSQLSNTYHELIRKRGILEYCAISKCGERRATCGRGRQKCSR